MANQMKRSADLFAPGRKPIYIFAQPAAHGMISIAGNLESAVVESRGKWLHGQRVQPQAMYENHMVSINRRYLRHPIFPARA